MTLWKTDCCTQDVYMGKKRERFCIHGLAFERVREDGSTVSKRSSLKQGKSFAASEAQRAKVKGMPCVACGKVETATVAIDPAHVWPRGKGGCDSPDCVLPACRVIATGQGCHRLFDEGQLDLTERLADSEAWQVEQEVSWWHRRKPKNHCIVCGRRLWCPRWVANACAVHSRAER